MAPYRQKADPSLFTIRRIPKTSTYWRPPPDGKFTSGNFSDEEVSVDLESTEPTPEQVQTSHAQWIQQGYGLATCKVEKIETAFLEKQIDGAVYHDPIEQNPTHGVITGKATEKKKRCLANIFQLVVAPKAF